MSHAAPAKSAPQQSFMEKNAFILRRLHSLSGIVPIGLFMCFHLFTNAQMLLGTFQHEVDWIHSQPALELMEIGLIWLPLAFHAGLGIFYAVNGNKYSVAKNGGWSHRRYILQRITGFVALAFILFHVATLRWRFGMISPFFTHAAYGQMENGQVVYVIKPFAEQATALALQGKPLVFALYVVGVFGTVYHFANGLWTAAISWGLTLTVGAQKRFAAVCIALFVGLSVFSVMAFWGSLKYPITDADRLAYQTTKELYYNSGKTVILEKDDMIEKHFYVLEQDGTTHRITKFQYKGEEFPNPPMSR
jgi:succinate dehydrogenase / fumarate reductase cytochrome b subunit